MNEQKRSEEFLNAATAGLKNDPELRLDVQSELRSHLEAHQTEAEAKGLASDVAADEAVRAMGSAAELADSLERANRHRMRLRSLLKIVAQWFLAPLAVVIAVLSADWGSFQIVRTLNSLSGYGNSAGSSMSSYRYRKLTPEQRLVLYGDETRRTVCEKQKAIWEKWPKNKVYLHNYVTFLMTGEAMNTELYAEWAAEIAKLQTLDPNNARFDYILAGRLLDQAVETKTSEVKDPEGKSKTVYDTTIKDRAKLDEAMAFLKAGLAKPEFRRYAREMAAERLAIMGEPTSLLQEVGKISMLAGILLPDLSQMRSLERTSLFYGELLANEGRRQEADIFLNAHRRLVPQINGDSFTLIDVLVVGAIAGSAAERLPEIYEKLGDSFAAVKAKEETAAFAAPVKQWKEKINSTAKTPAGQAFGKNLKRHGGILAGMLLPALGEYPTSDELAPSRHLEYVVAEVAGLAWLSVMLIVMLLTLALMASYYRWIRGGGAAALLLLPSGGDILRILGLGVLAPILLYYGISRWLPWTARDFSLLFGFPQFIAQYLGVLCAILMGTIMLADNCVRRRCRELLLPVAPPTRNLYIIGWVIVGVLLALGMLPQSWLDLEVSYVKSICMVVGVWLLLMVLAGIVHYVFLEVRYGRKCAAYYGSLARTLIPVVALTLIIVNISSRPYLRISERKLLAKDTVMRVDGGFTAIESRVTQRLKSEIQKVAETLPSDK